MKYAPEMHKLSNGVTVILDPMDIEKATMRVAFYTGSRDELPEEYGILHFAEHMLVTGTKKFPTHRNITNYTEDNSGSVNASTSNIRMQVFGKIISENFPILADLLGDMVKNSLFDEKKIENEKLVIFDELRRKGPINTLNFIYSKIFPDSKMQNHILGTPETLRSFNREKLLNYLNSHLSAKKTVIGISGNFGDKDKVLKQLEALFGYLPSFDLPDNTGGEYKHWTGNNDFGQNRIILSILFPALYQNTLEIRKKISAIGALKSILGRRLNEVIREQNGLVYSINTNVCGDVKTRAHEIECEIGSERLEKGLSLISNVVSDILTKKPITIEELNRFRATNKLENAEWFESTDKRLDSLFNIYNIHGKLYDAEMIEWDNQIDENLTIDDLQKEAQELFSQKPSIITQGPIHFVDLQKVWDDNFIKQ